MSSFNHSTGYGPRDKLIYDGDEEKYELWEARFMARLRTQKLSGVVDVADSTAVDAEKNANIFAELVQLLDDKSLQLIIRDANEDGRKAIKILRDFYRGNSKPRIIGLYTELTSLVKSEGESITDYLLRAEKSATSRIEAVRLAAKLHNSDDTPSPLDILRHYGGRDIAGIVGVILAARHQRIPVILDGYVVCAAAAVLYKIKNSSISYNIYRKFQ